eukprot:510484_1
MLVIIKLHTNCINHLFHSQSFQFTNPLSVSNALGIPEGAPTHLFFANVLSPNLSFGACSVNFGVSYSSLNSSSTFGVSYSSLSFGLNGGLTSFLYNLSQSISS